MEMKVLNRNSIAKWLRDRAYTPLKLCVHGFCGGVAAIARTEAE